MTVNDTKNYWMSAFIQTWSYFDMFTRAAFSGSNAYKLSTGTHSEIVMQFAAQWNYSGMRLSHCSVVNLSF